MPIDERDYMKHPPPKRPQSFSRKRLLFGLTLFVLILLVFWHFTVRTLKPIVLFPPHANPNLGVSSPSKSIDANFELFAHTSQSWFFPMWQRTMIIQWHLEATSPVNLLLFHSFTDESNYRHQQLTKQPYNTYNCSTQMVSRSDGSCAIEGGAVLLLENLADTSTRIILTASVKPK
jgi:hypothetical protein